MSDVRIEIENCYSLIYGHISPTIFIALQESLSYKMQNCEYVDAYNIIDPDTKRRQWDGRIKLIWNLKNKYKFATGLLSRVRAIFDEAGITYSIRDSREKFKKQYDLEYSPEFQLRSYQLDAINAALKKKRGIIKAATGAGKTAISAGIIKELGLKGVIFMAMSGDLVIQARDELQRFILDQGKNIEIGIVGAGFCDIKNVNVCTAQTIIAAFDKKYVKIDDEEDDKDRITEEIIAKKEQIRQMVRDCRCMIFDEVQHASCDTVKEIMTYASNAFYRFGQSASPWRDDGADLFIDSQFGREIVDISASFLIRKKYLVKPYITFITVKTERATYSTYPSIYKNHIVLNTKRNKIISDISERHCSRGETVLILVKQITHGKELEGMIDGSVFISGKVSVKKRKEILDGLRENKIKIAIATSIFDEGIDVRRLSCLVMAGSGKSSTRALQRVGRVIRKFDGKKCAYIYDFMDTAKYISSHAKKRRKIYKTEKEFEIREITMEEFYEIENDNWGSG